MQHTYSESYVSTPDATRTQSRTCPAKWCNTRTQSRTCSAPDATRTQSRTCPAPDATRTQRRIQKLTEVRITITYNSTRSMYSDENYREEKAIPTATETARFFNIFNKIRIGTGWYCLILYTRYLWYCLQGALYVTLEQDGDVWNTRYLWYCLQGALYVTLEQDGNVWNSVGFFCLLFPWSSSAQFESAQHMGVTVLVNIVIMLLSTYGTWELQC